VQPRQPKAGPGKLNTLGVVNIKRSGRDEHPYLGEVQHMDRQSGVATRVRLAQDGYEALVWGSTRIATNVWHIGTHVRTIVRGTLAWKESLS